MPTCRIGFAVRPAGQVGPDCYNRYIYAPDREVKLTLNKTRVRLNKVNPQLNKLKHLFNKLTFGLNNVQLALNREDGSFSPGPFGRIGKLPENSGFVPDARGGVYWGTVASPVRRIPVLCRLFSENSGFVPSEYCENSGFMP